MLLKSKKTKKDGQRFEANNHSYEFWYISENVSVAKFRQSLDHLSWSIVPRSLKHFAGENVNLNYASQS